LLKPDSNLVQIVWSFSVFSVLSVVDVEELLNFQSLAGFLQLETPLETPLQSVAKVVSESENDEDKITS
jgi:hypothetical protein